MDRRLIDRRLRKLEADLPDPVPEPVPDEKGPLQIEARFVSGMASTQDFRVWFTAKGERLRADILQAAKWWDRVRHTPEGLRLGGIPRLVLEIVVTPPDEPTPPDERRILLSCARATGKHRQILSHSWSDAVLGIMAIGGPDGLPLRREFAARREDGFQRGSQTSGERT